MADIVVIRKEEGMDDNINNNNNGNINDINYINDDNDDDNEDNNNNNNTNTNTNTSPYKTREKRRSTQGIQDRLWEKEQLQEINLRVDNIFGVFMSKVGPLNDKKGPLQSSVLNEIREQQNKAIKDMTENFLSKEGKKAKELAEVKAQLRISQEQCANMEQELKDLDLRQQNLKRDHANLRNERDQAVRDKERALIENQNMKEALDAQLKPLELEVDRLHKENDELKSRLRDVDDDLRKQFATNLAQTLQTHEEHNNKLKEQADEAIRKQITEMQEDYNKQMEEMKQTLDAQKKELADYQNEILSIAREKEQLKSELEMEKPLRESLQNKLKNYQDHLNEQSKHLKDKFNQQQKEYQQMCDEYFNLERINLELRNEIETLKTKLDAFEEEYKIQSPVHERKRRRTDHTSTEPRVLRSVQGPLIESNAVFPLECITRKTTGEWRGFELQNQWSKPIFLTGWFLVDGSGSSRLPLPEKRLNPKEIIRVCLTENKKEPDDLVWKDLKLQKDDTQELWVEDNFGLRRHLTTIPTPSTGGFAPDTCLVM